MIFVNNIPLTKTAQIFVVKLTFLPRVSNRKPLYISRNFSVYRIIRHTESQYVNPTRQQVTVSQPVVDLTLKKR